jgi:hypothetical protein
VERYTVTAVSGGLLAAEFAAVADVSNIGKIPEE